MKLILSTIIGLGILVFTIQSKAQSTIEKLHAIQAEQNSGGRQLASMAPRLK